MANTTFSPLVRAGLVALASALAAVVATVPNETARIVSGVVLAALVGVGIVPPQVKS